MAKKTKKLEVEMFQVRAQLERASSAKLDKMLSIQKSASDRIGLEYWGKGSAVGWYKVLGFLYL